MNRYDEYLHLADALSETPSALESTVDRALKRENTSRKKARIFGIPAGSLAACFIGFILLVNCFPTFAYACGGIPFLRDLAKAVAWSPSLSAAVENQYVQPIRLSQTKNGITATIEYLIVDQKQVNIFYTLHGDYEDLSGRKVRFTPDQHCSASYGGAPNPPGTLQSITLDYVDNDVPDGFSLTISVSSMDTELNAPPQQYVEDAMLDPNKDEEPEYLAEFTFNLKFDPTFTAVGETIPVNQMIQLAEQTITITEAQIFPTHVRINVADHADNTAWLCGLDFYLVNEHGKKFEPISNGITATGSDDTQSYVSFRLESSYFSRCKHLTLCITGSEWLEKEHEKIFLDLANQTAEYLPEGVAFKSAEKRGDKGWILKFQVKKRKEDHTHQVFYSTFLDEAGETYSMGGYSSYSDYEGDREQYFIEELPLPGYHGTTVWLKPTYTHTSTEATTITIPIK